MFVWTSGFQSSLAHTDFNMFVDEWTSANESPDFLFNSIMLFEAHLRTWPSRQETKILGSGDKQHDFQK